MEVPCNLHKNSSSLFFKNENKFFNFYKQIEFFFILRIKILR